MFGRRAVLTPILLRPPADLAAAMTTAAEESGCSRQTWMLAVLTDAVTELGHYPPQGAGPDDVPLWSDHE